MAKYSTHELREAYENHSRVSDECAASADYNAFADLFTEDCTYVEHVFGEMHGREAVRQWIVPLMQQYPNDQMTYTHDWVYESLTSAGYRGHLAPIDAFWGNRYCEVDDADGHTVGFHSPTDESRRT